MKCDRFNIKIKDIIPQQHFLSQTKLNKVIKSFEAHDSYGDIYVIKYDNLIFSVDGHHRLFYLYNIGVEEIEVVNELEDNNNKLYQILADEARKLGIKTI
ncbi:ParB/RepB/Spo0J family partition protein [Mycoplasmatota bacterium]|nr:ParB/RepB/Spo0J family partition protein [Mycoplasmatota bacterium]